MVKVVLFGTPPFAVPSLERLVAGGVKGKLSLAVDEGATGGHS